MDLLDANKTEGGTNGPKFILFKEYRCPKHEGCLITNSKFSKAILDKVTMRWQEFGQILLTGHKSTVPHDPARKLDAYRAISLKPAPLCVLASHKTVSRISIMSCVREAASALAKSVRGTRL